MVTNGGKNSICLCITIIVYGTWQSTDAHCCLSYTIHIISAHHMLVGLSSIAELVPAWLPCFSALAGMEFHPLSGELDVGSSRYDGELLTVLYKIILYDSHIQMFMI